MTLGSPYQQSTEVARGHGAARRLRLGDNDDEDFFTTVVNNQDY